MKKPLMLITLLALSLFVAPPAGSQDRSAASDPLGAAIMRPDPATRDRWYREYLSAPRSHLDPVIQRRLQAGAQATKPFPLLLDHIVYTPSERDQYDCGNCWVWAGTSLVETKHSVEQGVKDRLSIQWFDSQFFTMPGGWYACKGGTLAAFVDFFNQNLMVPWLNAPFKDQAGGSAPHVNATSISLNPAYDGEPASLQAATIPTAGETQATAIANIKNVLHQKKAVEFNFWLATQAQWNAFKASWRNQAEATVWDPDTVCGATEDAGYGGHAVTIVGYDDTDADTAKHYWIVLNSWGAPALRPNGLFRMKMYMNYDCYTHNATEGKYYYSRQFQNVETVPGKTPFFDTNSLMLATRAYSSGQLWTRQRSTGEPWSRWTMFDGTSSEPPAMASFNTKQWMVRKGESDTSLWIRSQRGAGPWTRWILLAGATDAQPALAVYRNRLYLFVKTAGGTAVQYKSMGTNGIWTAWQTVGGWGTNFAPAVVANNDELHLFLTDTSNRVLFRSMRSDGSWGGWGCLNWGSFLSDAGPAVSIFDDRIHVVARGKAGTPNASKLFIAAGTETPGIWYIWAEIPGGGLTSRTPRLGWGPDQARLTVAVVGTEGSTLWTQTYVKGSGWNSGWTRLSGNSNRAPSLSTYWFQNELFPTSVLQVGKGR